jgi:hypothetical protein
MSSASSANKGTVSFVEQDLEIDQRSQRNWRSERPNLCADLVEAVACRRKRRGDFKCFHASSFASFTSKISISAENVRELTRHLVLKK